MCRTAVKLSKNCALNGKSEVPIYFLKVKQGYTVKKMERS